jgi:hypothetical protein
VPCHRPGHLRGRSQRADIIPKQKTVSENGGDTILFNIKSAVLSGNINLKMQGRIFQEITPVDGVHRREHVY